MNGQAAKRRDFNADSSMFLIIWDGENDPSDLAVLNQLSNNSKVNRMKNFLINFWQDEEGAETAEWLVIVSLITAVGVLIYNGVLAEALGNLVGAIEDQVLDVAGGGAAPPAAVP